MSAKEFIMEKISEDLEDGNSDVAAVMVFVVILLFPIVTIFAVKKIVENTLDLAEYGIFIVMSGLSAVVWAVITWVFGWNMIPIYLCLIQSLITMIVLIYNDYHGWADKKSQP